MNLRVCSRSGLLLSSMSLAAWGQAAVPSTQTPPDSVPKGAAESQTGTAQSSPEAASRPKKLPDSSGKGWVYLKNDEQVYGYLDIWFEEAISVRLEDGTTRLIPWAHVKECCDMRYDDSITPPVIPIAPYSETPGTPPPQGTSAPAKTEPAAPANSTAQPTAPATSDPADVTPVGAQPSPRQALYLGLGLGGGRVQDDIMGHGGVAFDINAGYSFTPTLSLALNFDGLLHSEAASAAETDAELEGKSLSHFGIAAGAQAHVLEMLRFSLEVGYYWLHKDGPLKPLAGEDQDPDVDTYHSPGGEFGAGFEFFQSPGGFAASLEVRSQLSFPDQELVWNAFALLGARWYGIGRQKG